MQDDRLGAGLGLWEAGGSRHPALSKGDPVSMQSDFFRVAAWTSQDNSPQGQLEVTARRVDFIITKREQVEADDYEPMPF